MVTIRAGFDRSDPATRTTTTNNSTANPLILLAVQPIHLEIVGCGAVVPSKNPNTSGFWPFQYE